jgi:hypothetical protein
MRTLFALLVGFLIAFALFMLSPLVRELANKGRQRLYFAQLKFLRWTMPPAMMAAPVDAPVRGTAMPYSDVAELVTQHNNLVTALRGIATKLDADATVTDVNYFALWLDAAIATAPKKLTVQ